jgi:prepilin-type N-terminal cleavage/methylation domain-containing protein
VCGRNESGQGGFTLIELLVVMAAATAIITIALPRVNGFLQFQKASEAARMVERELQTARLKAVSASRTMRVKFNCPAAGQFRLLEVTSVASTDNAANRCDPVAFPTPGPNDGLRSTPSLDGPVRYLPPGTTVSATFLDFEFDPRGAAHTIDTAGVGAPVIGDLILTVTRSGFSRTVTINALGKVRLN